MNVGRRFANGRLHVRMRAILGARLQPDDPYRIGGVKVDRIVGGISMIAGRTRGYRRTDKTPAKGDGEHYSMLLALTFYSHG